MPGNSPDNPPQTAITDWGWGGTKLRYWTARPKKNKAATDMIKDETIMEEHGPSVSLLQDRFWLLLSALGETWELMDVEGELGDC